jgi:hypothetical protein
MMRLTLIVLRGTTKPFRPTRGANSLGLSPLFATAPLNDMRIHSDPFQPIRPGPDGRNSRILIAPAGGIAANIKITNEPILPIHERVWIPVCSLLPNVG